MWICPSDGDYQRFGIVKYCTCVKKKSNDRTAVKNPVMVEQHSGSKKGFQQY